MKSVLACMMSIAIANVAHADWQYSKWGMTPDQVKAASGGKAEDAETMPSAANARYQMLLTAPYDSPSGKFDVEFVFGAKDHRLAKVFLNQRDKAECRSTLDALTAKYGQPAMQHGGATWRDADSGNAIEWADTAALAAATDSSACWVMYQPLNVAGAGL